MEMDGIDAPRLAIKKMFKKLWKLIIYVANGCMVFVMIRLIMRNAVLNWLLYA